MDRKHFPGKELVDCEIGNSFNGIIRDNTVKGEVIDCKLGSAVGGTFSGVFTDIVLSSRLELLSSLDGSIMDTPED